MNHKDLIGLRVGCMYLDMLYICGKQYLYLVINGTTEVKYCRKKINNGIIYLYGDSANNILDSNNGAEIVDKGTNNIIK